MRSVRSALLTLLVAAAAGCGEDAPDLPTGPSTDTSVAVNELFQGTIAPGATAFYSFRVIADRNVTLMLASLTSADGRPIDVPVTIGFGVPQGTGCGLTRSTTATPALQAHIDNGTPAGTYCVNLAAPASLPGTANFAIRIRHEPSEPPDAAAATATFASQLALNGSSTRTFPATQKGTVSITLESLGPQATRVGLAVGLPPLLGSGCLASRMVEVVPGGGPHLSVPVDIGTYCVAVIDVGALSAPVAFQVRIQHP